MSHKTESNIETNSFPNTEQPKLSAADIFSHAAPSMVQIKQYWGAVPLQAGSGFFVNTDSPNSCEIVTSRSVADGEKAFVTTRDGKTYQAKAEVLDHVRDLSIYRIENVENQHEICRPLQLETHEPKVSDSFISVTAAGDDPFLDIFHLRDATAANPKFREGHIKGWTTKAELYRDGSGYEDLRPTGFEEAHRPMLTATRIGVPGYAGGPWLNMEGKVIGLTYGANTGESAKSIQEDLEIAQIMRRVTNLQP